MVTPQLVEYIKKTAAQGFSDEKISEALVKKGWNKNDVAEAFRISKGIPLPKETASTPASAVANVNISAPATTGDVSSAPTASTQPAQPVAAATNADAGITAIKSADSPVRPPVFAPRAFNPASSISSSAREIPIAQAEMASSGIKPNILAETSAESTSDAAEESPRKSRIWIYAGAGITLILATYVYLGATQGLFIFGVNLFPFQGLMQKLGFSGSPVLVSAPTASPSESLAPASSRPVPPTPQPTSGQTAFSYLGNDVEAGSTAILAFSPDGTKAAYSILSDSQNLWTIDLSNGSRDDMIKSGKVSLPGDALPMLLAWSPDGTKIAIVARNAAGIADLLVTDLGAKTTVNITRLQEGAESVATSLALTPKWNHDGSEILAYIGKDLWRISSDGTSRSRITAGLPIGSFNWAENGLRIVYTIVHPTDEKVWIMDADGRNYRPLTASGFSQMPLYVDTGVIYYIDRGSNGNDSLWQIRTDGSNPVQIRTFDGSIREYSLAPSGKTLGVITRRSSGEQSLWTMDADGNNPKEIAGPGENEALGYIGWGSGSLNSILYAGSRHFIISAE
jgi:Tol biopolymer transport system component